MPSYNKPVVYVCVCRKEWTLLRDDSIFVDWQRLKVQENVEEVSSTCSCFAHGQ